MLVPWGFLGFPQEIVFRNVVKNIQAVAYNGARTVYIYIYIYMKLNLDGLCIVWVVYKGGGLPFWPIGTCQTWPHLIVTENFI